MFGFVTQDDLFPDFFRGYAGAAKVEYSDENRLSRCLFERVPDGFANARKARMEIGMFSQDCVPELVKSVLAPSEPVV